MTGRHAAVSAPQLRRPDPAVVLAPQWTWRTRWVPCRPRWG